MNEQAPVASNSRLVALLLFCVGLTAFVFVDVGGRLSLGEIISIPIALFAIFNAAIRPARFTGALLAGTILMVVGLIISGALHGNGASETQAGVANYSVLTLTAIALAGLLAYTRGRGLTWLLLGAAAGQLLGFYFTPTESAVIDPWKFAIGWAVNVAVLVFVWGLMKRPGMRWPATIIGIGLAGLNVSQGSRSAGVLVALCAVVFLFSRRDRSTKKRSFIVVVALLGLTLIASTFFYENATESGYFGVEAAQKLADQSGNYGVLFGARKELLFLALAFAASPLVGWGAAARVPSEVRFPAYEFLANGGYFFSTADVDRLMLVDRLPLHSVFLGALVQSGIFAVPLAVLTVVICVHAVRGVVQGELGIAALFVVLSGIIHLVTSPLGDTTRIQVAFALAIGMYAFHTRYMASRDPVSKPRVRRRS